jgi:hypothetical protein
MWIYVQKTGNMYHNVDGTLAFLANGYAGRDQYQNDPASQCVMDFGPLPRGTYSIAAPTTFNFMTNCLRLMPVAGNDMCNPARAGFWIHDGVFHGPHGDSSHGCICLQPAARLTMWASDDHWLQVVGADPGIETA